MNIIVVIIYYSDQIESIRDESHHGFVTGRHTPPNTTTNPTRDRRARAMGPLWQEK